MYTDPDRMVGSWIPMDCCLALVAESDDSRRITSSEDFMSELPSKVAINT